MGSTWDLYTGLYYGLQVGSIFILFILIRILIPHDLINWILETLFYMKKDDGQQEHSQIPLDCICRKTIWEIFRRIFACKCCKEYRCCIWLRDDCHCPHWCYRKDRLENKQLPHHHPVELRRDNAKWYCGYLIHINISKFCVYLLLCISVWCAAVAFFEAIILSYSVVQNGDTTCPIPKYAASTTNVDCFAYRHSFDSSPANKSFPNTCNGTSRLTFVGDWAGCYAWVLMDVEVADVLEELGICSGIIAFLGSTVTLMSYLCRQHRWRLLYDIIACLAIVTAPTLIKHKGDVPFLTYILLLSLLLSICITQFLLGFVPLLTVICIFHMARERISIFKSNTQPTVTPSSA